MDADSEMVILVRVSLIEARELVDHLQGGVLDATLPQAAVDLHDLLVMALGEATS